jgi:hypothetical protein
MLIGRVACHPRCPQRRGIRDSKVPLAILQPERMIGRQPIEPLAGRRCGTHSASVQSSPRVQSLLGNFAAYVPAT